jgi:CCS family citrate carrier protein
MAGSGPRDSTGTDAALGSPGDQVEEAIALAPPDANERDAPGKAFWPSGWWKLMELRIGVIPLPIFLLLGLILFALSAHGKLTAELSTAICVLAFFGFAFAEIGKRIPLINMIGGAAILATFIPSALTYYHILPPGIVKVTKDFIDQSNIMYLFLAAIIVGSIFSMDRRLLLGGFLKIFVPLAAGTVAAAAVGTAVGTALGLGAYETFFFVVVPIMAGGIGEGAIPLSIGYAAITGLPQSDVFATIMPAISLGNLTSVLFAGALNWVGRKYPRWSGEGRLQRGEQDEMDPAGEEIEGHVDVSHVAAAGITAIALYLLGMTIQIYFAHLPGPVVMLFLAVAVKLARAVPPQIEQGSFVVYKFFSVAVTFPLLFAIGVAKTPWDKIAAAFTLVNLITIMATVATLMLVGALVGHRLKMYPIEAAVVNACHSGMGGLGDVAILTAANRMFLMPFAQISTRIGGAITVLLVLTILMPWFAK